MMRIYSLEEGKTCRRTQVVLQHQCIPAVCNKNTPDPDTHKHTYMQGAMYKHIHLTAATSLYRFPLMSRRFKSYLGNDMAVCKNHLESTNNSIS